MDIKDKSINMKGIIYLIIICLFFPTASFGENNIQTIKSPNNQITVELKQENNLLGYKICNKGETVLEFSKLGLSLNKINFTSKLRIISSSPVKKISDDYEMTSGKKIHCIYNGNERIFKVSNKNGNILDIIFRVSNDGVAFRYNIKNSKQTNEVYYVKAEFTTFNFESSVKAWLHPREKAGTGWCRTQPSYEENYQQNVLVGTHSPYNEGWTFPSLFKTKNSWILLSETDMPRNYCASHLSENVINGEYSLAFPDSIETLTGETATPNSTLDWTTPWRLIIIGNNLANIVESTLSTDLATNSKVGKCSFAVPGKASWSWALLNDTATIYPIQKEFIDYASQMKWAYCLIDGLWDSQIGYDKIKELTEYANKKNVGLWLWYNSAGKWNDTPQTPRYKLIDSVSRKKEFQLLHEIGIRGIKVDFFPGDGQSVMKYYQDILSDAAKYELMVNFHGATLPRGWKRTYPNLMTAEAVKGFEYRTFKQVDEDVAANHCCMLPFTRNVVAPMDFTPVCFSEIKNINRTTSNAFELALSVIFESGIQHFVEIPSGMKKVPEYVQNFLSEVPVAWDEVRFIDGYPGEYVVFARKKGDKWYIAGINGKKEPIILNIDISFIKENEMNIITDGQNNRSFSISKINTSQKRHIDIKINSNGGFVLY